MHAPFSPPTSSSSSSQSLNYIAPTSQYDLNLIPAYGSFPLPPSEVPDTVGSELDGMGQSFEEDEDRDQEDSRGSRGSSRDTRDGNGSGMDKRKPRITLPRGGACVVCR